MEEAYEKQSRTIDNYVKEIQSLKEQQIQLEGIIANH
jgi:hypothetical protein